jgi:hypothetical protein
MEEAAAEPTAMEAHEPAAGFTVKKTTTAKLVPASKDSDEMI